MRLGTWKSPEITHILGLIITIITHTQPAAFRFVCADPGICCTSPVQCLPCLTTSGFLIPRHIMATCCAKRRLPKRPGDSKKPLHSYWHRRLLVALLYIKWCSSWVPTSPLHDRRAFWRKSGVILAYQSENHMQYYCIATVCV